MTRQIHTESQYDKRKFSFFALALFKEKFSRHNARETQAAQSDTQTKACVTLAFFSTSFY